MKNTIGSVTWNLGLRQSTVRHFCYDFGIKLEDQFIGNGYFSSSIFKQEFIVFLKSNKSFLLKYQKDFYSDKTPSIIAQTIKRNIDEIEPYLKKEYPQFFENGVFNKEKKYPFRYVSSYKIDYELGSNYSFLKNISVSQKKIDVKSNNNDENKKYTITDIIGYEDILDSILEQVEPILNPKDIEDWGLNNPGGLLLFGPPGCGKTFWAKNISKLINYKFEEIPRSIFGSSLVDGAMINLKKKLNEYSNKSKIVLFFDEFDSIASLRNNQTSGSTENSKVVNTLLQEIPKLIERKILIVAATNYIDYLDTAVIRPGRFDLKIPVFPPNVEEKSKLIAYKLCNGLRQESPLLQILKYNNADKEIFWREIASKMTLFSTSLVIDFTQLLKRQLKLLYNENPTQKISVDEGMLNEILKETSSKLTSKDAEINAQFFNEVKSLGSNYYQDRLDWLYEDLDKYFSRFKKPPPRPIGFRQPNLE